MEIIGNYGTAQAQQVVGEGDPTLKALLKLGAEAGTMAIQDHWKAEALRGAQAFAVAEGRDGAVEALRSEGAFPNIDGIAGATARKLRADATVRQRLTQLTSDPEFYKLDADTASKRVLALGSDLEDPADRDLVTTMLMQRLPDEMTKQQVGYIRYQKAEQNRAHAQSISVLAKQAQDGDPEAASSLVNLMAPLPGQTNDDFAQVAGLAAVELGSTGLAWAGNVLMEQVNKYASPEMAARTKDAYDRAIREDWATNPAYDPTRRDIKTMEFRFDRGVSGIKSLQELDAWIDSQNAEGHAVTANGAPMIDQRAREQLHERWWRGLQHAATTAAKGNPEEQRSLYQRMIVAGEASSMPAAMAQYLKDLPGQERELLAGDAYVTAIKTQGEVPVITSALNNASAGEKAGIPLLLAARTGTKAVSQVASFSLPPPQQAAFAKVISEIHEHPAAETFLKTVMDEPSARRVLKVYAMLGPSAASDPKQWQAGLDLQVKREEYNRSAIKEQWPAIQKELKAGVSGVWRQMFPGLAGARYGISEEAATQVLTLATPHIEAMLATGSWDPANSKEDAESLLRSGIEKVLERHTLVGGVLIRSSTVPGKYETAQQATYAALEQQWPGAKYDPSSQAAAGSFEYTVREKVREMFPNFKDLDQQEIRVRHAQYRPGDAAKRDGEEAANVHGDVVVTYVIGGKPPQTVVVPVATLASAYHRWPTIQKEQEQGSAAAAEKRAAKVEAARNAGRRAADAAMVPK